MLCLQETKAPALTDAARQVFDRHGYEVVHVGANAYNGVAIAARHPLLDVVEAGGFGDEHLDREPRLVAAVVRPPDGAAVRVASVYVPHGRTVAPHVVVARDINVAATDSDVFHPDAFVGSAHVTPRERDALGRLFAAGLVDVDVAHHGPRARRFTWWNHGVGYSRNLGMRLDVIAADPALAGRLAATWIDHEERGRERPSDHAALLADFFNRSVDNGSRPS